MSREGVRDEAGHPVPRPDRRHVLKTGVAALSAAALGGCAPDDGGVPATLEPDLLRAVARLALPTELGTAGTEKAVRDFERWLEGFEAAAERNHGYGTSEIRYGPEHPGPRWAAQLQALDIEARARRDAGFAEISPEVRGEILRRRIEDEGPALPEPARARHVAVGLLAWWLATPEARDRCYGVRISALGCRGLSETGERPEPLTVGDLG